MNNTCSVVANGTILNASHPEYPLFKAYIYGGQLLCAKLSKRISCVLHNIPIRIQINYIYDITKAIEAGVRCEPTLFINEEIFIEGLISTEEIYDKFMQLALNN